MSSQSAPPRGADNAAKDTPLWLTPLFLIGLALVFLGERVLEPVESMDWLVSGLGVLCAVVSTAARFFPRFQSTGDRQSINRLLAALSVVGLVGLAVYFSSTEHGLGYLGFEDGDPRDEAQAILRVIYVCLIALSVVPLIFAETSLYPMRRAPTLEKRRVRTAIMGGAALSLAAIYASLFTFAAKDLDLDVDFRYFKTSEPSASTQGIIDTLTEPVEIIAFFPEVNPVKDEVATYLGNLSDGSEFVTIRVVDRLTEPALARKLRVTQDGVIVFTKGDLTETLRIGTEMKRVEKKLRKLDEDFQGTLNKVAVPQRHAYLTVGHGELNDTAGTTKSPRTVEGFKQMLKHQNFTVKSLGIPQGLANDVPDDADLVVIFGPSAPFSDAELASLQRYAESGGRLFIALDPDQGLAPPGIVPAPKGETEGETEGQTEDDNAAVNGPLAAIVGLEVLRGILAHETKHVAFQRNLSDRRLLHTTKFSSHSSVSELSRRASNTGVVVLGSSGLDQLKGRDEKVNFAVRSPAQTFSDLDSDFTYDKDAEKQKVFNLAAAVTMPIADGEAKGARNDELRAYVIGDADAFTDPVVKQLVGNQYLAVDAVRWLGGAEIAAGAPNTEADVAIQHTRQEDLMWFYAIILGIPLIVLGLGLLLRRQLRKPPANRYVGGTT